MKKHVTHRHTHSLIKMSTLGLSIGLLAGFLTIFLSETSIWYSAPVWFRIITGTYGTAYTTGSFDTSGGGGNGGQLTLIGESEEVGVGGDGLYINPLDPNSQELYGNFFLETVGWVEINPADRNSVALIPPTNQNIMTPWELRGSAWSNAGYITMEALDGSYSWVHYTPGTQTFTGYAWSDNLGYIPFSSPIATKIKFKNQVKILGNIGGNKAYDIEYALGVKFDAVTTTSILNTVRKNVAISTRWAPPSKINISPTANPVEKLNRLISYKLNGGLVTDPGSKMNIGDALSIIVEGGDIYISADVAKDPAVDAPRSIIAVKNAAGQGGNIYIWRNVKNIYSSLVAEWSIYSWESSALIYNDSIARVTNLPQNQLYIYGSVISRNTIGWSARTPYSCPYTETTCDYEKAVRYDWNYFRNYDKKGTTRSTKLNYDEYSIIIEHDPRIIQDAPPGLSL